MPAVSGPNIPTSGLILSLDAGNYRSYPATGTIWTDLVTKSSSTLSNVSYSSSNQGLLSYNGTNSTTVASNSITGVSQFTVTVWFKTNVVANYNNVLDFNYGFYGNANAGPRLEMAANGSLAWVFSGNTTNVNIFTGYQIMANGLQTNTWYHAAITRDSTPIVNTYLNGVYQQSSRQDVGSNLDAFVGSFNKITTGVGWSARFHNGFIASVLAYNRSLSANEVYNIYHAEKGRFGL